MKVIILFSLLFIIGILQKSETTGMTAFGDDTARFCIVTGEKIEGNGVKFTYLKTIIELCCDGCRMAFNKEPAKYLKEGLICIPCGEEDANKDISHVHNGTKYYFCSKGCKSKFANDTEKYLIKFNE